MCPLEAVRAHGTLLTPAPVEMKGRSEIAGDPTESMPVSFKPHGSIVGNLRRPAESTAEPWASDCWFQHVSTGGSLTDRALPDACR